MSQHDLIAQNMEDEIGIIISNGSTTNFDCDSLSGWIDQDDGNGISSQETFEDRETFKLDGGATFDASNRAGRFKTLSSPGGDRNSISVVFNPVTLGAAADASDNFFRLRFSYATNRVLVVDFYNDDIGIYDSSGVENLQGVAPALGVFQVFTADITGILTPATAVADCYLGDTLLVSGLDVGRPLTEPSKIMGLQQFSRDTPIYTQRLSYVDQLLIGDGLA